MSKNADYRLILKAIDFTVLAVLWGSLFLTADLFAVDYPAYPTAILLYDDSGARNALEIDCEPDIEQGVIKCAFYQMSVSYKLDHKDHDAAVQKEIKRIHEESKGSSEEIFKTVNELCQLAVQSKEKFDEHIQNASAGSHKAYLESMYGVMNRFCNVKTLKEAQDVFIELTKISKAWETQTCKVWPNVWSETFSYKSTYDGSYWLASTEPSGPCGVINVSTLRKDKKDKYFWQYESKRIITNNEGKMLLSSCSVLEERTVLYTWRPKEHDVDCKVIKFGF